MKVDREKELKIPVSMHGDVNSNAPEQEYQSFFYKPMLSPNDKSNYKSETANTGTLSIPNHNPNSWNPNESEDKGDRKTGNGTGGMERNAPKILIAMAACFIVAILAVLLWPCSHEWIDATCTTAKICSKCEQIEGIAQGHQWKSATCTQPSICIRCKGTSGVALGHTWNLIEEKDCVEAKVITYSQCSVCKKRENQITDHLKTLLSDDGKTFLFMPVEFGERLNAICAEWNLNVACRWADKVDGDGDPGIEIKAGSNLPAVIWLYGGSNINNLEHFNEKDKNRKSEISMMQMVMNASYSETGALATAFIMAIDPAYENDPEGAYEIVSKAFENMQSQRVYEHGEIVYETNVSGGVLRLFAYTKSLLN